MTDKAKNRRQTLRAEGRASQLSREQGRSKSRRKAKRKAKGKTDRGRGRRSRPSGWRRLLKWSLLAILVGPALVLLAYRFVPPPVTPLMLIRAQEGEEIDYRWTPLERISPHLAQAVIASEDNRFCDHWGFDFGQVLEIFDAWVADGTVSAGRP